MSRFKSNMWQKLLFLAQVWSGRRQVPTGFSSIYTHFGDRFVQVWSSLALVFVWAWVRFEQVREQKFRFSYRCGTGLNRFKSNMMQKLTVFT